MPPLGAGWTYQSIGRRADKNAGLIGPRLSWTAV